MPEEYTAPPSTAEFPETGRKPESAEALLNLARVLDVPMGRLVGSNRLQLAFHHLREFVAFGVSEADVIAAGQQVLHALRAQRVPRAMGPP